jgi:Spy/CpxP family protein refolding chaperone
MLRKLTLGLVAAASLGAMALAPTAASAGGGGWGGGWHHHHFAHGFGIGFIGGGYGDDGCYVTRRVRTPFGYRLRTVNVCEY